MTEDEMKAEAVRFNARPTPPDIQARSDAMVALAATFRDRAITKVKQLERLRFEVPAALEALNLLYDIAACEYARVQALDCGTITFEEALAMHGLAPSLANRAATLRSGSTN